MNPTRWILPLSAVLALAGTLGCRAADTFNAYDRIALLDYQAAPAVQARVAPVSLQQLKFCAVRHLQSTGLFREVDQAGGGGMDTVFVQGTVVAYRPHRLGGENAAHFSRGLVDLRGASTIDYRFFDTAGRTLLLRRVSGRFNNAAPVGMDPTAEEAALQLARLVQGHKNIMGY